MRRIVLLVSALTLLSACTPPLPPEVLAGQAEATIDCATAVTKVSGPAEFAPAVEAIAGMLIGVCPDHSIEYVPDDLSAEVEILDHTPSPTEVKAFTARCESGTALVAPAFGMAATISLQVTGLEGLVLDARAISGLIDGSIKSWDDQVIQDLNPEFILDPVPVIRFVTNDKSAAVLAITSWAKRDGDYAAKPSDVIRGDQTFETVDELAAELFNVEGAFGIVPLGTAVINGLNTARLQVTKTDILTPEPVYTMRGIATTELSENELGQLTASVAFGGKVNENLSDPLIDPANFKSGWPALGIGHVLACEDSKDLGALPFARFVVRGEGQGALEGIGYTRLPLPIRLQSILALKTPLSEELLEQIKN